MNCRKRNRKYVFEKEGVYFSLTVEQIDDMASTLARIQKKERSVFMCVVDGYDDPIETCVWDNDTQNDCVHAMMGVKKEDCEYWKRV